MKITRRELRKMPLLEMCKTCPTDSWEPEDDLTICQCRGRYDSETDEPLEDCEVCHAWQQYEDWEAVKKDIQNVKDTKMCKMTGKQKITSEIENLTSALIKVNDAIQHIELCCVYCGKCDKLQQGCRVAQSYRKLINIRQLLSDKRAELENAE